jgi:pyridoxamine 5'-phosphate oxidase
MADKHPDLHQRIQYEWGTLDEADLGEDPVAAMRRWLVEAEEHSHLTADFNAMVLCTVDPDGQPSARNMLLRGIDELGRLQFFTNRLSRKGVALAHENRVCLLFSWLDIHRQVRVDGVAEDLDDEESSAYFAQRPRDSQLAAWASAQSEVIGSRRDLEAAMAERSVRFEGGEVPRPEHWGGYAVVPSSIEFWQGRPNRLHDRIEFVRDAAEGGWARRRLSP